MNTLKHGLTDWSWRINRQMEKYRWINDEMSKTYWAINACRACDQWGSIILGGFFRLCWRPKGPQDFVRSLGMNFYAPFFGGGKPHKEKVDLCTKIKNNQDGSLQSWSEKMNVGYFWRTMRLRVTNLVPSNWFTSKWLAFVDAHPPWH